eukprot:Opistho-2@20011
MCLKSTTSRVHHHGRALWRTLRRHCGCGDLRTAVETDGRTVHHRLPRGRPCTLARPLCGVATDSSSWHTTAATPTAMYLCTGLQVGGACPCAFAAADASVVSVAARILLVLVPSTLFYLVSFCCCMSAGELPAYMSCMMDASSDFHATTHPIETWFGASEFLVLSPSSDGPVGRSAVPVLLGSLSLAADAVGCCLPLFVQLSESHARGPLVFGAASAPHGAGTGTVRTDYECVRLPSVPRSCAHVAGLIDVFRSKIGDSRLDGVADDVAARGIDVSVRFTYFGVRDPFASDAFVRRDTGDPPPSSSPIAPASFMAGATDRGMMMMRDPRRKHALSPIVQGEPELNWGLRGDPVGQMHLCVAWPSFAEDAIVDNAIYSELDPIAAPVWSLRVLPSNPQPTGRLADAVGRYVACCACDVDFDSLRVNADRSALSAAAAAMSASAARDSGASSPPPSGAGDSRAGKDASRALTDPSSRMIPKVVGRSVSALSSSVGHMTSLVTASVDRAISSLVDGEGEPPRMEDIERVFADLFSDDPDSQDSPESAGDGVTPDARRWDALARRLKAAPADTLTHLLAVYLCRVGRRHGGMRGVALFWTEFLREIRWHWESLTLLPRMSGGDGHNEGRPALPDMSLCVLHQKLQMLNCCIHSKMLRDAARERISCSRSNSDATAPQNDDEDNDEFFEAAQDESEWGEWPDASPGGQASPSSPGRPQPPPATGSEGVVQTHETLRILGSGEPLGIPATQEAGPMTEDMVHDQAEVFARLDASGDGAAIRARMQAASLLSDMEAFKAANPSSSLADFVRWHSPRDWVLSANDLSPCPDESGVLSARMSCPGNLWAEVWAQARPIPANRQRPLFDCTREAEKVLHFLESLSVGAVHRMLLPSVVLAAFRTLHSADVLQQTQLRQRDGHATARDIRGTSSTGGDRGSDNDSSLSVAARAIAAAMDSVPAALDAAGEQTPFGALLPLSECEALLGAQASLGDRLPGQRRLVAALLESDEAHVATSAEREAVAAVFVRAGWAAGGGNDVARGDDASSLGSANAAGGDFGVPDVRECVLRAVSPRPSGVSQPVAHRLYCGAMPGGEFRLAGAISRDGLFR